MSITDALGGEPALKIGLLVPRTTGGGGEAVAREWASYLASCGAEGVLYTYDQQPDDAEGAVALRPDRGKGPRLLRLARAAAQQIDADVDVMVGVLTYSNLVLLLASLVFRSRWRVVISEHNVSSLLLRDEGFQGRCKSALARLLYRRAAGAIGVSHAVTADLRGYFGIKADKSYTLPNPIPNEHCSRVAPRGTEQTLGVLGVGRLVEQKRFDLFLRVILTLSEAGVKVHASIVGDGPLRKQLENTAAAHGLDVEFCGWRSPWADVASGHHVLLATSSVEGFGNVLVEAADRGLPCAVSAASLGSCEAIIPGVTGVLALDDDPRTLAEAVLRASALGVITAPAEWRSRYTRETSGAALLAVCRRAKAVG